MTPEIEEFARKLPQLVRDSAIQSNDGVLLPTAQHRLAKRWKTAAHDMSLADFARVMIPDIVDDTLFYLLRAIDEGEIELRFMATNGKPTNLTTDGLGELAGWYIGSGGWRERYSNERFVDDCADLA